MAQRQFLFQVVDAAAHGFHQHQQVVGQVGGLIQEPVPVAVHSLDDGFRRLFSDFLGDGLGALPPATTPGMSSSRRYRASMGKFWERDTSLRLGVSTSIPMSWRRERLSSLSRPLDWMAIRIMSVRSFQGCRYIKKGLPHGEGQVFIYRWYESTAAPALSVEDMVVMMLAVEILTHTVTNVGIIPDYPNFSGRILQFPKTAVSLPSIYRGVAQLASASALGAEGRRFESYYPDKYFSYICREYEVPCIPDP